VGSSVGVYMHVSVDIDVHLVLRPVLDRRPVEQSHPFRARYLDGFEDGLVTRSCRAPMRFSGHSLGCGSISTRRDPVGHRRCNESAKMVLFPRGMLVLTFDCSSIAGTGTSENSCLVPAYDVSVNASNCQSTRLEVALRAVVVGNCPSRCSLLAGRHPQGAIAKQVEFSPSRVTIVPVGYPASNMCMCHGDRQVV
jgi:hypothetical protein